jgi:sec-independent protein translocase protein TatA
MGDLGWPEILIIAIVVLVLFGSAKLPGAARSLGRSLRIFKAETKGLRDDDVPVIDSKPSAPSSGAGTDVTSPPSEQQPVAAPPAGSDSR